MSTDGTSAIVGANMYDRERGAAYLFDVVEPPGPVELLEALARAVVLFAAENPHGSLGFGAGESRPGDRDSLLRKIDLAIRALEESGGDDSWPAVRVMESFIHAVEARRGRFILDADAEVLLAVAREIIALIEE